MLLMLCCYLFNNPIRCNDGTQVALSLHRVLTVYALQQLQVGVEFEASTRMQDTSVSFGYQLDVPKANLQFKGRLS